ncbi:12502_t:CDS:2, partial [Dentiscutata heterogama]
YAFQMDQLKIMQTRPVFTVYPDKTGKKFTQYNNLEEASSSNTTLPDLNYILFEPVLEYDDTNSKWTDSAIKLLLAYLSENFSYYCKNKEKFYARAALHIGGKSNLQVRGKLQGLVRKYSDESKEKTGKGTSKWPYYSLINEIFGNRENVHPETLHCSNNIGNEKIQRGKKPKLNENNSAYIESVATISESKKLSAKSRRQWNEAHSEIERDKLKAEKDYREENLKLRNLEYELKKKEVDARIKIEEEKFEFEKRMKEHFEQKLKELELRVKELEINYKHSESNVKEEQANKEWLRKYLVGELDWQKDQKKKDEENKKKLDKYKENLKR